jgi:hypothetical protein
MELVPTTSSLVCAARGLDPERGGVPGTCCICQIPSADGFPVKLPATFQSWAHFQECPCAEQNVCACCRHVLTERKYRNSSWLAVPGEFRWLDRPGVRGVLNSLPNPPWALYATRSYKKHGWLQTHVNTSSRRFFLTFDDEEFLLESNQLTGLTRRVLAVGAHVGRSRWLKGSVRLRDVGELALEDPSLHSWFVTHGSDSLVRALVYFMIPTRSEVVGQ